MSRLVPMLAAGFVAAMAALGTLTDVSFPLAHAAPLSLRADGAPQRIGNGTVRTYVLYDPANRRIPIEVGLALTADALNSLPAPMSMKNADAMSSHFDTHERLLELPQGNPTPYRFVQFNWNPGGHEPPGVYDQPHFDFHFWTVSVVERNAIVPENPQFAEKAARYPAPEFHAPFYVDAATAAKAPPAAVTVPKMGLHWLDVRSPELQGLTGHPERFQQFTKTFIYGSWDGQFVFDEPMITRAYLSAKRAATESSQRDEIIAVPTPARRAIPGYYPQAYRITYDAESKEYRIALTRLTWQD
jgi:hypothetical protein